MSLSDTTSLALMRDVPSSFPDCLRRTDPDEPIDLSLARRQHQRYRDILKTEGFRTHVLPPQDLLPDSCFVEDTMIALDSVLVITRPGAPSRREEAQETSAFLESVRPQVRIEAPGTVDGGDVFLLGKQLYVGTSSRTNADGIAQLTSIASHHGIKVTAIALHGCLHLRSAVSPLDDETVLLCREWVDPSPFANLRVLEVGDGEQDAANVIRMPGRGRLLVPEGFDHTREMLETNGFSTVATDNGEFRKGDGALTCLSIRIRFGESSP